MNDEILVGIVDFKQARYYDICKPNFYKSKDQ
jgi:hypothetical protein